MFTGNARCALHCHFRFWVTCESRDGTGSRRAHLTAVAAGGIAREAVVRRIEPFHFSPRYSWQEARLLGDVMTAFAGQREKSH
jgi:ribonuclease BN (tRNA processing enzyme)